MSLELNALKFTVDTSAFDQAIKKIDQLTTAVGEVTSKGKSQKISVDTKDFDSGISKAKKFGDAIEEINRSQRSLKLSADIQEFDSAFTRVSQSVKALERPLKSLKLSIDTKDFDSGISKVNKALSALSKPLKAINLRVDSKGLDDAIKKVADLKVSLEGVNKAIQANVVVNAQAQKAQADMAIAAEKVKKAQAETLIVEEKLVAAKAKSENAQARLNKADQESVTILQRQQYIREFMTQGFTRGQSSILAYAKAANTADSEMQELMNTLKSQRALIGGDPFDKSLSAIEGMKNEFKLLRAAQREYGAENSLTIKQLRDLALEKERVLERMKIEKANFSEIKAAIRSTTQEYRTLANASGEVSGKLKGKDQAVKDTVKANKFLEDQLFQVDYRLKEVDKTLSTGTVNALRRFETAVRKSNKPLQEQDALIKQYRESLTKLQGESGNRAADTISRAIGPQITDIVIGLATGQSLYMVALQQGGQLRDQLALAGIEANKMGSVMRTAAKEMVTSVASVTVAFGQLFAGMAIDGGRAITGLFGKGVQSIGEWAAALRGGEAGVQRFRKTLDENNTIFAKFVNFMKNSTVLAAGFGLGLMSAVTVAVALAASLVALIKQENALSKALALNGATLGMNKDSAYALVAQYRAMGVNGNIAAEALTKIAESGKISSKQLDSTIRLAETLKTRAGIPIEETIKMMEEIAEGPTEALGKYARAMGNIPPEIVKTVMQLEQQGQKTRAVELASKALEEAGRKSAKTIVEEYGYVMTAFKAVTKLAGSMWDAIMGVGAPDPKIDKLLEAENKLKKIRESKLPGTGKTTIEKQLEAQIENLKAEANAAEKRAAEARRSALVASTASEAERARTELLREREKLMTREQFVQSRLQEMFKDRLPAIQKEANAQDNLKMIIANLNREYDKMKESSPGAREAKKEQESLEKYYARILNAAKDYGIEATAAIDNVSEAMREYAKVANDPKFAQLDKAKQNRIKSEYQQRDALKELYKANEELFESFRKLEEVRKEQELEGQKRAADLQLEAQELQKRKDLMSATPEEQAKITAEYEKQRALAELLRKEQEELYKIAKDPRFAASEEDRKKAEQAVVDYYREKRILAEAEAAQKMKEFYQQKIDEITSGIADAVVTALFEGGKAGSKKLRDLIVDQLRKPITIYIEAQVKSMIQQGLGSQQGSGGGGILGTISNLFSTGKKMLDVYLGTAGASAVSSIGSAASGLANITNSSWLADFATGVKGSYLAPGLQGPTTAGASGATGAGSQVGGAVAGAANVLAGVMGGLSLGKMISGGYSASGKSGNRAVNTGTAIGAAVGSIIPVIGTALGALIGGALGGAVNRLFGRKLTKSGIEGTFSGDSFTGNEFEFYKGGTFRSNKTKRRPLDNETRDMLSSSFSILKSGMVDMAKFFGVESTKILNYSKKIKLNLKGKSADGIEKAFTDLFNSMQEDMAKLILAGTNYNLKNEKAVATLQRLKNNLDAVNMALFLLGDEALKASLATADASYKLTELFGGLDKFQSSVSSYYDKFYTEEEKLQKSLETLVLSMAALGLGIPATREEFRKLVNSQDLTTESGRQTFKALIDISDTFWQVTESAEQARKKFEEFGRSLIDYVNQLGMQQGSSSQDLGFAKRMFAEQVGLARMGDETAQGGLTGYADRLIELAKESASSALEYETILGSVKSELLGLAAGTGVTTALTPLAPGVGSSPATAGQTVQQQNLNMQSLLQSIYDKLSEMSSSDRAEAVGVVSKLGDIAKVVTRADNGDSINVTVVT